MKNLVLTVLGPAGTGTWVVRYIIDPPLFLKERKWRRTNLKCTRMVRSKFELLTHFGKKITGMIH